MIRLYLKDNQVLGTDDTPCEQTMQWIHEGASVEDCTDAFRGQLELGDSSFAWSPMQTVCTKAESLYLWSTEAPPALDDVCQVYEVGGAVRDSLLSIEPTDRDYVVVGATPALMQRLGFNQEGFNFPVFLHPDTGDKYTLARTDRKVGIGYKGFMTNSSRTVRLSEDLERRDLTINAIARTLEGKLIDPHNGMSDLQNKVLRHVNDAFAEDPLRVLRVARLAATLPNFTIAPATKTLMMQLVRDGALAKVTAKRVWREIDKALTTRAPATFLTVLREVGALQVILPEIDNLFGVPQPPRQHPEIDTGVHTLMALQQAVSLTNDPAIRFAVMVHDLGKARTPKDQLPQHKNIEKDSLQLLEQLTDRLQYIPRKYEELAKLVIANHTRMHQIRELRPKKIFRLLEDLGTFSWGRVEWVEEFALANEADARGRQGWEQRSYPHGEILREARDLAVAVDVVEDDRPAENLRAPGYYKRLEQTRIAAIRQMCRQRLGH